MLKKMQKNNFNLGGQSGHIILGNLQQLVTVCL